VAALELFTHCENFVSNVSDVGSVLRGRLTIAVFDGCSNDPNCQLHQAIADVKATSDAVQFEVIVAPPDEVEIAVLNGRAMIGISTKRTPSEALEFIPLYDEVSHLYCAPTHPLAQTGPKESKKLMSGIEYVNRAYIRGASPFVGLNPTRATSMAHSEEAVAHLVLSGQFVGFLPEHFARIYVTENRMTRVAIPELSYSTSVGLVRTIAETQNPLVSAFIEKLLALTE
jgi:DNA-binding transcriptional LysR family regulator